MKRTIFIRHKMDIEKERLREFRDKGIVAVHFDDIPSITPDDYDRAGHDALSRMHTYCLTGAIVGAAYHEIDPTSIV